ncbi:hypothetical protein [Vibrio parahaemolyticus]|uniref:hypothetical protein n=1 Tax=Vibrio parahaemolyticus TaxID=670 RepID=UPI001552811F|nr:hypothetical protein [Vibrio parahaemolyticus]
MSLWGFLGAGLAYLLMTFAFVFGGIFWLCAEGNTLRETKRQSSIMSGIIICSIGTWVIALALLRNSDEKPNLLKLSDCYTIY